MRLLTLASSPRRRAGRTAVAALLGAVLLLTALPAAAQQSGRLGDADDPVFAAIELSRGTVADGEALRVVLGRSDAFPDSLAGAAATLGEGPLLLVDPAPQPLAADVVNEIERVLGPGAGGCENRPEDVLVLGGTLAIDESVVDALQGLGYCPIRLAGQGRVETSVEIASYRLSQFLQPGVSRGTLMIATGGNPADSASASAWAAAAGAPIVVTEQDSLNPLVEGLLRPGDTQWDNVILLGGEAALTDDVLAQVEDAVDTSNTTVYRAAGETRDDTAFRVASELWGGDSRGGAIIVEGFAEDFWQAALPAAAAGGRFRAPLLYVQTDRVPTTTDFYLRQWPVTYLWTVGSQARVSEATRLQAEGSLGSGVPGDQ